MLQTGQTATGQRVDRRLAKRWGRVSARPSEYLIKLRRGKVVAHGPGLSVWLWPGQTCTILPTSIQRASFVADQITAEKVGVAVTGIAGPDGGSAEKPVGTVFLALASAAGERVEGFLFRGGRDQVRQRSACTALDWLRRHAITTLTVSS